MAASARDFSLAGDQFIGISYDEIDCQKLVEKMLAEVGIRMDLKGSNAWYRYCREHGWTGTPEECRKKFGEIPVGAWLFIHAFDGGEEKRGYHDGLGNASHIGVYIAREGGAIHASASRGCVAYSKFAGKSINGGWNMVGLPTELLDYGKKYGGGNGDEETLIEKKARVVLPSGASGQTVNLRESDSRNAALVIRVPVGSEVTVARDLGEWCEVKYLRTRGYMMSNYLEYAGQEGESHSEAESEDAVTLTMGEVERIDTALREIVAKTEEIWDIIGRG